MKKEISKNVEAVVCHCGKTFNAMKSDLKRGWAKSCSKSCAAILKSNGSLVPELTEAKKLASANTRRNTDAREDDLYTTPFAAVHHIMKREKLTGDVLDPGCGTGNISEVVKQYNRKVKSIDLNSHGYGKTGIDYLSYEGQHENVVCNPPFKLLSEFINQALNNTQRKVMIFCRVTALESAKRYEEIYSKNPPQRIYYYVKRINCSKGGQVKVESSAVFYCWIVWDSETFGPTESRWIDNRLDTND